MLSEAEIDRRIKSCLFRKKQAAKVYMRSGKGLLQVMLIDKELETLIKIRYN